MKRAAHVSWRSVSFEVAMIRVAAVFLMVLFAIGVYDFFSTSYGCAQVTAQLDMQQVRTGVKSQDYDARLSAACTSRMFRLLN